MKSFWVRKFYHKNEKEMEISQTLPWIFTCSYNTAIVYYNTTHVIHVIFLIRRVFVSEYYFKSKLNNRY